MPSTLFPRYAMALRTALEKNKGSRRAEEYEMELIPFKEPLGPSDDRETAGQPPQLSAQQQRDLAAIENYAQHFGLEQEGLAFAHEQAGLSPPTEEQKQAAERGLPLRPEQPAKKPSPSNHGGFYLGETSQ